MPDLELVYLYSDILASSQLDIRHVKPVASRVDDIRRLDLFDLMSDFILYHFVALVNLLDWNV